mmetsp:Transcript_35325/g.46639  ORF Transcript_35325/g.46639 Transcript_35325/m.46639 type:complete len:344 (-) Transcript_35325:106-1137(-)
MDSETYARVAGLGIIFGVVHVLSGILWSSFSPDNTFTTHHASNTGKSSRRLDATYGFGLIIIFKSLNAMYLLVKQNQKCFFLEVVNKPRKNVLKCNIGADHLSALATLSVNTSWKKALRLGMRWGFGHSAGIILITIIFLSIDVDLDTLGYVGSWLVGIFLILLGAYGIWRARKILRRDLMNLELLGEESGSSRNDEKEKDSPAPKHDLELQKEAEAPLQRMRARSVSFMHSVAGNPYIQKAIAFGVGVIHGVAGPGGILGVIPALEQNSWAKAMYYLCFFTTTSTIIMGLFSAIYGEITARMGGSSVVRLYHLNVLSSLFSLVIGVAWVILLPFGILHDFFE